jgi:peptide/nickel transport system substrate-binding protein
MFAVRRTPLLASLLLITALLLTACPPQQVPGAPAQVGEQPAAPAAAVDAERAGTVIFDIDGGRVQDPELWNPFVPGNRTDHGYQQAILEPLFILNYQTGEFIPWLGESFEANDTLDVWTLTIRQGVEWSDGEAFTADDVIFTIDMLRNRPGELGGFSASMDQWVESVNKVDDLTVEFVLTDPNPRFQLDYFSVKIYNSVYIMPEHIWADQDPMTFKNYDPAQGWPIGTGPYTLASVSPTEFVYVRNDDWWGAKTGWRPLPQPERLVWTWAGPPETRAALMNEHRLDSLMDVTLGALLALQAQSGNIIAWYDDLPKAWVPDPCSRTFEFNLGREPWNDPEMRWAVNYVIDRDQIVEIAYESSTFKSRHFFPAYPPLDAYVDAAEAAGAWDTDQLWTTDTARAAEILESKGYVKNGDYYELNGQPLTLDITTHEAFIEKQRIAQVVVEQLQAFGINASTRNEAGGTWGDNHAFGNFESRMGWQTCGSVNEPWNSLDTFSTNWLLPEGERASRNWWRWEGPGAEEYSALVEEMGTLPLGDPRVEELFIQAMEIWFDELPAIPITQAKKIIPFDTTYWTNWPTAENDYIHPPTWWQHTHYIIHNLQRAQ